MGISVRGITSTSTALRVSGGAIEADLAGALREAADEIIERARNYAPVDEENLEDAIDYLEEDDPLHVVVGVDMNHPGTRSPTVSGYAEKMHEGDYQLGKRSQDKQAALGVMVGPKYLERAVDEVKEKFTDRLRIRVRESTQAHGGGFKGFVSDVAQSVKGWFGRVFHR